VVAALMRLANHAVKGVKRVRGQGRNLLERCDDFCGHVLRVTTTSSAVGPESSPPVVFTRLT